MDAHTLVVTGHRKNAEQKFQWNEQTKFSEREKNANGADAAYAAVVTKYPDSRVAPNALYKRAQIALQKGNTADAKKLLQEVISRYPKSNEADIAADQLKQLR